MSDSTQNHSQHHRHSHGHHHDPVAHANKDYFDNPEFIFEKYPFAKERAVRYVPQNYIVFEKLKPETSIDRVAKAIVNAYKPSKEKTIAMDFACGNGIFRLSVLTPGRLKFKFGLGLVSEQLIPYTKSILGVDISQRMAEQYNEKLKNKGASAICAELKGDEGELDGARFDMIFVSDSVLLLTANVMLNFGSECSAHQRITILLPLMGLRVFLLLSLSQEEF
jgi:hypothetical protein